MSIGSSKKISKIILRFGILPVMLLFTASASFIISVLEAGAETIEYDNPLNTDSIIEVVERIADYFYYVAIAIVPIITIYAAVLFFTAGGSDSQIGKAKKTFFWLVIGIAILLIGSGVITLLKDILNVN